ncbi:MAG: DUF4115 domain-containing protein [Calditrichaceae bacterium]|nr:DUF4115 domain-containing protein [Calditrichaceae bacterium]MBN2708838.1 DUF4115 domain-containing protein [Calditrichaceae bacterium]RQV97635.1 MAG: DUF4115 domain-containing protein [Calditrichota bacterium]
MEDFEKSIPFFEQLKKIRISKKLDLKNISEKSRIQVKYLQAIEEGQFEVIPEVYDKLFFQTYLGFLELDKETEVNYYNEFRRFRKISEPKHTTTIRKIRSQASDPEIIERFKKLYIGLPILLIVLIVIILALNSTKVSTNDEEPVEELSVRQVAQELEQKQLADSTAPENTANAEKSGISPEKQVSVGIRAIEDTWLRLVKDKKDTLEYLLRTGNNLTQTADSTMEFLIGKAYGIRMTINSKNIGVLGERGDVVSYMKVTSAGIVSKRLKRIGGNTVSNVSDSVN